MGKVCTGSFYGSDWLVYTREDAIACENAGGRVVESGDGGCTSTNVAAMAVPSETPLRGAVAELSLSAFRQVRRQLGEHPLIKALLETNQIAAAEIARIAAEDKSLQNEMVEAFVTLSALADAVTQATRPSGKFDDASFARFEKLGRRIAERTSNQAAREAIDRVLGLARPLAGMDLRDIARKLKGDRANTGTREVTLPSQAVSVATSLRHAAFSILAVDYKSKISLANLLELLAASRALEKKAASLGWAGNPTGDVEAVPGGYRRSFQNADILVGDSGVAYEVHGEIRAKYNMLGGPGGPLGLPVTDETGTPDGKGRYNHFQNQGSIYWTATTGPMMVQGRVRDEWASQGWETGPMGYPVRDQHSMPALYPSDHPNLSWCLFQNGCLFAIAGAAATAVTADITPEQLRTMVRSFFDQKLKQANGDLGLEANCSLDAVSDWGYGFWASSPRLLSFGLHGFHDNGALPDTTFDLQVRLRFSTTWPMAFTYPSSLSLIVSLYWLHVHTTGLGAGDLADGLSNGIQGAFYRGRPDPDHPEVPDGAIFLTSLPTGASQTGNGNLDVIDVLTTAQGGLQVLLNPLPPIIGGFRKEIAQSQVNAFLGL